MNKCFRSIKRTVYCKIWKFRKTESEASWKVVINWGHFTAAWVIIVFDPHFQGINSTIMETSCYPMDYTATLFLGSCFWNEHFRIMTKAQCGKNSFKSEWSICTEMFAHLNRLSNNFFLPQTDASNCPRFSHRNWN